MSMTTFPQPYGPIPSPRQLAWHALAFYGFIHFTVNTFTDLEWGRGDESPALFNPTDFSADQIAGAAALGGMSGLILTAKHHDGFCLWPSDFTEHSVKNSPWQNGRGDVVAALARACQDRGLKFGIYLSPWDRNHPQYGRPAYIAYYRSQLRELLTRYGPLFEVWFDGANGGDGYYGGRYERREIDARTYYEWDEILAMIRELQPQACIFGGWPGADVRWTGNEQGIAGDPCWHTFAAGQGEEAGQEILNRGMRDGTVWFPAECDVSIRPGWFYHASEDKQVRTPENLLGLYHQSVGRGANLLLNLPPDRRGRIHEADCRSLEGFRRLREDLFARNLASQEQAAASSAFAPEFDAGRVLDGSAATYWTSAEGDGAPELVLDFDRPVTINLVSLREYLPLGQRVEAFALDTWQSGGWQERYRGTAIGSRRLVGLPGVKAGRLRLRITRAPAGPAIQAFDVYGV